MANALARQAGGPAVEVCNPPKHSTAAACVCIYKVVRSYSTMRFGWDDTKNVRNYRKHGVWFEEAQTIWADPHSVEFFDPDHGDDEDRFLRIGYSTRDRLLLVVFCERCDGDVVRLISARRATAREAADHEEGI